MVMVMVRSGIRSRIMVRVSSLRLLLGLWLRSGYLDPRITVESEPNSNPNPDPKSLTYLDLESAAESVAQLRQEVP